MFWVSGCHGEDCGRAAPKADGPPSAIVASTAAVNEDFPTNASSLAATVPLLSRLSVIPFTRDGTNLSAPPPHATCAARQFDHPRRKARTSCSGRTGVALTSIPNGANASHTALATAAGGATAPPSPTPLTPSGFNGEGEC